MTNQQNNDEAGVVTHPLLHDFKTLEGQTSSSSSIQGASFSGAVFNISTTMIGAGIMSIPATMKVLGIIPGFIAILVVAVLTEVTVEFMLRYTNSGKSETYAGMVGESFGPLGSIAVQVCIIITNLGCLIIYFIIIGDVLCGSTQSGGILHLGMLQEWFGIHWWNSRAYALLFIAIFVMLPLVLLRRVDSLRHTSAISILLAVVFVAICSATAIYAVCKGRAHKLRLFPDFAMVSIFDIFTSIPVVVTSFGFHVNVHPIRAELGEPSDMKLAGRISLLICVTIYFSIGFFGYLLFGDSIMADMLVNFDQNSGSTFGQMLNVVVRSSYAMHLLLVFPVMHFSLRANIDELLFPNKPVLAESNSRFLILTCVLLSFSYFVAIAIPNIWYFFQFMGSTTVVCLSFIFPGALILRDGHGISTTKDKIIAILVMVLAVVTSSVAISGNFYTSTQSS
ncbi:putative amino acid transporter, transmembrane domain-containing protein [Rosa chinensis]|uniref:Putative amino acid transporter, transmembrane domain-containing protein n=1 Tax=Rosa chinensis TaxID=74649 RepID=A0A2P6SLL3_ROSCH|nr:amino acid transporter AVT6C [Rosa chinensis]PRQ59553.1 putative amino acid transporter, transmembrane domain-containing protein [Rosa chinensis]